MNICSKYFQILLVVSSSLLFHAFSLPSQRHDTKHDPKVVNCSSFPGAMQPNNLVNSAYYLIKNGSLCCPPRNCPSTDKEMEQNCGNRGTVHDPCFHCMTCAKLSGEDCHGHQFRLGRCGSGLSCINVNGTVLTSQYDEGVCTNQGGAPTALRPGLRCGGKFNYLGKCEPNSICSLNDDKDHGVCVKHAKTKGLNQTCGGRYGRQGRCAEGLRCSAEEDEFLKGEDIKGVCYINSSAVCFKDCGVRDFEPVCGDNGRWYNNICYLRQSNCPLQPTQLKVRKISDQKQQEINCGVKPKLPATTSRGRESKVRSRDQGAD